MLYLTQHPDLAFSAARIQTREVAGANFKYSKILGLPYLGAGMVDVPPHGSKRSKNSRRMHMVFCVLSGKVNVTVGDAEFSISKGGVWMVPRGEQLFCFLRFLSTPRVSFFSFLVLFLLHQSQPCCIAGPGRKAANANLESVCKTTYV